MPGAQREEAPELYKSLGSKTELRFDLLIIFMEPQIPRGGMGSPGATQQAHNHQFMKCHWLL